MTDLDQEVPRAIAHAESIPTAERPRDGAAAWLRVAQVERPIASHVAPSSVSCEASRIGAAARAAVEGRDLRLAHKLAAEYVTDPALAERPRAELVRLLEQVTRDLERLTWTDHEILPVHTKIAA